MNKNKKILLFLSFFALLLGAFLALHFSSPAEAKDPFEVYTDGDRYFYSYDANDSNLVAEKLRSSYPMITRLNEEGKVFSVKGYTSADSNSGSNIYTKSNAKTAYMNLNPGNGIKYFEPVLSISDTASKNYDFDNLPAHVLEVKFTVRRLYYTYISNASVDTMLFTNITSNGYYLIEDEVSYYYRFTVNAGSADYYTWCAERGRKTEAIIGGIVTTLIVANPLVGLIVALFIGNQKNNTPYFCSLKYLDYTSLASDLQIRFSLDDLHRKLDSSSYFKSAYELFLGHPSTYEPETSIFNMINTVMYATYKATLPSYMNSYFGGSYIFGSHPSSVGSYMFGSVYQMNRGNYTTYKVLHSYKVDKAEHDKYPNIQFIKADEELSSLSQARNRYAQLNQLETGYNYGNVQYSGNREAFGTVTVTAKTYSGVMTWADVGNSAGDNDKNMPSHVASETFNKNEKQYEDFGLTKWTNNTLHPVSADGTSQSLITILNTTKRIYLDNGAPKIATGQAIQSLNGNPMPIIEPIVFNGRNFYKDSIYLVFKDEEAKSEVKMTLASLTPSFDVNTYIKINTTGLDNYKLATQGRYSLVVEDKLQFKSQYDFTIDKSPPILSGLTAGSALSALSTGIKLPTSYTTSNNIYVNKQIFTSLYNNLTTSNAKDYFNFIFTDAYSYVDTGSYVYTVSKASTCDINNLSIEDCDITVGVKASDIVGNTSVVYNFVIRMAGDISFWVLSDSEINLDEVAAGEVIVDDDSNVVASLDTDGTILLDNKFTRLFEAVSDQHLVPNNSLSKILLKQYRGTTFITGYKCYYKAKSGSSVWTCEKIISADDESTSNTKKDNIAIQSSDYVYTLVLDATDQFGYAYDTKYYDVRVRGANPLTMGSYYECVVNDNNICTSYRLVIWATANKFGNEINSVTNGTYTISYPGSSYEDYTRELTFVNFTTLSQDDKLKFLELDEDADGKFVAYTTVFTVTPSSALYDHELAVALANELKMYSVGINSTLTVSIIAHRGSTQTTFALKNSEFRNCVNKDYSYTYYLTKGEGEEAVNIDIAQGSNGLSYYGEEMDYRISIYSGGGENLALKRIYPNFYRVCDSTGSCDTLHYYVNNDKTPHQIFDEYIEKTNDENFYHYAGSKIEFFIMDPNTSAVDYANRIPDMVFIYERPIDEYIVEVQIDRNTGVWSNTIDSDSREAMRVIVTNTNYLNAIELDLSCLRFYFFIVNKDMKTFYLLNSNYSDLVGKRFADETEIAALGLTANQTAIYIDIPSLIDRNTNKIDSNFLDGAVRTNYYPDRMYVVVAAMSPELLTMRNFYGSLYAMDNEPQSQKAKATYEWNSAENFKATYGIDRGYYYTGLNVNDEAVLPEMEEQTARAHTIVSFDYCETDIYFSMYDNTPGSIRLIPPAYDPDWETGPIDNIPAAMIFYDDSAPEIQFAISSDTSTNEFKIEFTSLDASGNITRFVIYSGSVDDLVNICGQFAGLPCDEANQTKLFESFASEEEGDQPIDVSSLSFTGPGTYTIFVVDKFGNITIKEFRIARDINGNLSSQDIINSIDDQQGSSSTVLVEESEEDKEYGALAQILAAIMLFGFVIPTIAAAIVGIVWLCVWLYGVTTPARKAARAAKKAADKVKKEKQKAEKIKAKIAARKGKDAKNQAAEEETPPEE